MDRKMKKVRVKGYKRKSPKGEMRLPRGEGEGRKKGWREEGREREIEREAIMRKA